jgi:hypothetical protein
LATRSFSAACAGAKLAASISAAAHVRAARNVRLIGFLPLRPVLRRTAAKSLQKSFGVAMRQGRALR